MLDYIEKCLGITANLKVWEEEKKLPIFLRNKIEYYLLSIEKSQCILMKTNTSEFSISKIENAISQLTRYTDISIALWMDSVTTYQRKALLKDHIPFIIPKTQMYLPFAGMCFKEEFTSRRVKVEKLTAMAQSVLLYIIYKKDVLEIKQSQIAVDMKLSAMNVSRSIKELREFDLIEEANDGRNKIIKPVNYGRDLYEISKEYMQSPVQKSIFLQRENAYLKFTKAGEEALSNRTMLNPPMHAVRALDRKDKDVVDQDSIVDLSLTSYNDYVEIQLWKYNPQTFADSAGADVISLSLSLKDCEDERVEAAVEEMLEEYEW